MSDELVSALREYPPHTWPTAQNAADRIEAQAAEIEELKALLREAQNCATGLQSQFSHAGCTCTFPSLDCCFYTMAGETIARIDAALTR